MEFCGSQKDTKKRKISRRKVNSMESANLSLEHSNNYVSIDNWIINRRLHNLNAFKLRLSIKLSRDGIIGRDDDSIAESDLTLVKIRVVNQQKLWKLIYRRRNNIAPPIGETIDRVESGNSVKNYIIRNNCITSAHTEIGFRFPLPFLSVKRSTCCCRVSAELKIQIDWRKIISCR